MNTAIKTRLVIAFLGSSALVCAQDPDFGNPLFEESPTIPVSLKELPIPGPGNIGDYVKNRQAAIVLGKALFWEMRAGGDGVQACASCHFHAGVDVRTKNTLNPGPNGVWDETLSTGLGGPNYQLQSSDFPLHKLANKNRRNSTVLFDTDDIIGSAGLHKAQFVSAFEDFEDSKRPIPCLPLVDPVNTVAGKNTRQTTGRNAPSVINAVFAYRIFWDGRANNVFNGVDPFGRRNPDAFIWKAHGDDWKKEVVNLENSALASQAVGPPLSPVEMSCAGREFRDIGRKLIHHRPLEMQKVDPEDSVLGPYRHRSGRGIKRHYSTWIKRAFRRKYWDSEETMDDFTLMEANFSFFWGVAIQLYESTLVSDDSKFDQLVEGKASFTKLEGEGMSIFFFKGRCAECHGGSEFSNATVSRLTPDFFDNPAADESEESEHLERMLMGDQGIALYDSGFYNIGTRSTANDIGLGGSDPWGNPLSFARQARTGILVDEFAVNIGKFEFPEAVGLGDRDAIDGAFKVPSLRNVELTGPYFHNGGAATLMQVVEFYKRGSDLRGPLGKDSSGLDNPAWGNHWSNFDPEVRRIKMNRREKKALVAFLKTLTDERVRYQRAPFDHPQLFVANGHKGDTSHVATGPTKLFAKDNLVELPAVGRSGSAIPLKPFLKEIDF